jgi:hypothetical protein
MPRSKRKAAAARAAAASGPSKDFTKKTTRLGKRKRSDSLVDASAVRSRKIYVPPQDKGERGAVSVSEHVRRAREHYNTHARTAALTALARIFADTPAFAADSAPVIRAGLEALIDEVPAVRSAALAVVLAVLRRIENVKPFASLLSSALAAALSHIRSDVRVHGARAVHAVFQLNLFSAADVFSADGVNPLPLLVAILTDVAVASPTARTAVANAIASLSCWTPNDAADQKVDGTGGPFYYHAAPAPATSAAARHVETLPLLLLDAVGAAGVVSGVANVVLEHLPVRDGPSATLVSSARALSTVVCDASVAEKRGRDAAARAVAAWAAEQVHGPSPTTSSGGAADVDASMASCAAALGRWDLVGEFVCARLQGADRGPGVWTMVDSVARRVISAPEVSSERRRAVADAWLDGRWQRVVDHGFSADGIADGQGAAEVVGLLRHVVLARVASGDAGAGRLVAELPSVIARIARNSAGDVGGDKGENCSPGMAAVVRKLVCVLADAVRLHEVAGVEAVGDAVTRLLVQEKGVMARLDAAGCAQQVACALWYMGLGRCSAVLALMAGGGGWSLAAAATRIAEQSSVDSAVDGEAGDRDGAEDLPLLAAALAALLASIRADDRQPSTAAGLAAPGDLADGRARQEVEDACRRLVRRIGVGRGSVEAVLRARGASAEEVGRIGGMCFRAT